MRKVAGGFDLGEDGEFVESNIGDEELGDVSSLDE